MEVLMHEKGNAATAAPERPVTWPTPDELGRIIRASGKLLEQIERVDWQLCPVYTNSGDDQDPTLAELGALTRFVSSLECDLESIGRSVQSLTRVRDAASPS